MMNSGVNPAKAHEEVGKLIPALAGLSHPDIFVLLPLVLPAPLRPVDFLQATVFRAHRDSITEQGGNGLRSDVGSESVAARGGINRPRPLIPIPCDMVAA